MKISIKGKTVNISFHSDRLTWDGDIKGEVIMFDTRDINKPLLKYLESDVYKSGEVDISPFNDNKLQEMIIRDSTEALKKKVHLELYVTVSYAIEHILFCLDHAYENEDFRNDIIDNVYREYR